MMNMKKVIAVLVAGALVISGFAVYAENSSGSATGEKVTITKQNRGNHLEAELTALVEKGYLDSATKETVLAAAKNFTPEQKTAPSADSVKTARTPGQRPAGDPMLTALKDKGLITEDVYNTVTAAFEKMHAAQRAEELAPLVSGGAFADTAAADKAMAAYEKLIRDKMDANRPAKNDTAATDSAAKAKPAEMTQAQREEMRTKMEAERTQAQTDALASLVSSGDITQAQSDAIKAFLAQKEADREAQMEKEQAARETQLTENAAKAGFADSAALKKAMETFHEKMKAQLDADRDSNTAVAKTKPSEEEMTAMKAAHEKAVTEVLSAMVASGDITQAQADSLKTLMETDKGVGLGGFGGPGHGGPGHGGPEGAPSGTPVQ